MKQFSGFPAKTQFTPIPNLFFSSLLSEISDINELKVILHIFWQLYQKRGYPRFVSYQELTSNHGLISSLEIAGKPPDESLDDALEKAVERGVIIHLVVKVDEAPQDVYLLNTERDRQMAARIRNGEFSLAGLKAVRPVHADTDREPQPDIFTLYEQNIGMLTPMIAEELLAAQKIYPEAWIGDAIKEAVSLNKHNWRYIARILEHWSAEGKDSGTYQRNPKKAEPDKYIKQKYGDMARH